MRTEITSYACCCCSADPPEGTALHRREVWLLLRVELSGEENLEDNHVSSRLDSCGGKIM